MPEGREEMANVGADGEEVIGTRIQKREVVLGIGNKWEVE